MPQGFIVKWNGPDADEEFDEPYLEIAPIVDLYGPRRNNGDPVAPVLVECKCGVMMMDYDKAGERYICPNCGSSVSEWDVYDAFTKGNDEFNKELESDWEDDDFFLGL